MKRRERGSGFAGPTEFDRGSGAASEPVGSRRPLKKAGDPGQVTDEVVIGDGESFEAALRRFNKKIQQAGILAEARRREYYERPAAKRKRKEAKRRKR